MADEKYFALDAVNATFLKACSRSLAEAHSAQQTPRKPNPSMALGTCLHSRALQGREHELEEGRLFTSDNATAAQRRADLKGMCEALEADEKAKELLSDAGSVEQVVTWEEQGHKCKAKVDKLVTRGRIVADLKSAKNASPRMFAKEVFDNWRRYDIQAAWYLRAAQAAFGLEWTRFIFIVVENTAPYLVQCYELDAAAIASADEEIDRILPAIEHANESGDWPGYGGGLQTIYLPAWKAEV